MRQVQFLAAVEGDGSAEHATGMLQHEVHFLSRYFLSGDDQVTLVLAVFIVHHDHELASLEVLNGFLYRVQFHFLCHILHLIYNIWLVLCVCQFFGPWNHLLAGVSDGAQVLAQPQSEAQHPDVEEYTYG